ncbi:MAG: TIM barrel protein [Planctomycetes bacterium]|nr:TIM barrel protein [Planctomycetota bacterium]
MPRKLGVCSWSLQPKSPADLVEKVKSCGLRFVQLALDPIRRGEWDVNDTKRALDAANIEILSGMMELAGEDYSSLETIAKTGGVLPDATWNANLAAAAENAQIAKRLGIGFLTFHAGVIPHGRRDPKRIVVLDRVRAIVDAFAAAGVAIALETGQESGPAMMEALLELSRPSVGVNFDPANMILYGQGEPLPSFECFLYKIKQIHLKDAKWTQQKGTWGVEVPDGTGDVHWSRLLERIVETGLDCHLLIEREAGANRVADIRFARRLAEYKLNDLVV